MSGRDDIVAMIDDVEFEYDGRLFSKVIENVIVVVEESDVLPDSWVVHAESVSNGISLVQTVSASEVDLFVDSALRAISSSDERSMYAQH